MVLRNGHKSKIKKSLCPKAAVVANQVETDLYQKRRSPLVQGSSIEPKKNRNYSLLR